MNELPYQNKPLAIPASPTAQTGPVGLRSEATDDATVAKAAREAVRALEKLAWARRIYEPDNRNRAKVETDAFNQFRDVLGQVGELSVRVAPTELLAGGQPVYSQPDRKVSLAYRLYRDGVRRLTFLGDLTQGELEKVVDILNGAGGRGNANDVGAQLWEAELMTITFEVIDTLGEMVEEDLDDIDAMEAAGLGNVNELVQRFLYDFSTRDRLREIDKLRAALSEAIDIEAMARLMREDALQFLATRADLLTVTADDLDRIRAEVDEVLGGGLAEREIETALAVALSITPPDLDVLRDAWVVTVDRLVRQGHLEVFEQLTPVFANHSRLLGEDAATLQQAVSSSMATPTRTGEVAHIAAGSVTIRPLEPYLAFLDRLGPAALPVAVGITCALPLPQKRLWFRSLIERHAEANPEALRPMLQALDPSLGLDAMAILELTGGATAQRIVEEMLHSDDPALRRTAVHALSRRATVTTSELSPLLSDSDHEIRLLALKLIIQRRERSMFPFLKKRVEQQAWGQDTSERNWMFAALAVSGREHALTVLEPIMGGKRGLVGRVRPDERAAAAGAIALMRLPAGERIIQHGALDDDPTVSAFCTKLLENPNLFAQILQRGAATGAGV
jgi:hypothetical protein